MKKALLIFLSVFIILVGVVSVYVLQNWSIIRILFLDTEATRANAIAAGKDFSTDIQNYMEIELDSFTPEEEEKIANGEVSAADLLVNQIESYAKDHPEVKENKENEIIIRYTKQFGELQDKYIGVLEGLLSSAKAEYFSREYSPAEKTVLLNKYMKKARDEESNCNGEFEALIEKMKKELQAIGADLSIIDSIRKTYDNEKAAKEVYYRDQYIKKV